MGGPLSNPQAMGRRLGILVAMVGLLAAACTGAPRPQSVGSKGLDQQGDVQAEVAGAETTTTVAVDAAGNPVAGPAAAKAKAAGKTATTAVPGQSTTPGV